MTAQRGKDLLLKVDSQGEGGFVTVAGLRARTVAFNAAAVDVTSMDSPGQWRELLAGAGIKTAKLNGGGVFRDAPSDELVRRCFFNGEIRNWQTIIPDFGVVAGPFQVTALELSGRHDGELTFEIALESSGELTFSSI
jgi:TP901-1 family phage major tail protein